MKKAFLITSILSCVVLSTSTLAREPWEPREPQDPSARFDSQRSAESQRQKRGYRTSTGRHYQYDLSKPSDQIRYEVDPAAQLRDSLDVSPLRELEQDLGQYGGGISRD